MSPKGVSDGLTRAVVVNSILMRPVKHREKDTDRKRVKRDGDREWEQLGKINTMRLRVWQ